MVLYFDGTPLSALSRNQKDDVRKNAPSAIFPASPNAMPTEPEPTPQTSPESEEKKLCVSCLFGNDPDVHFCAQCGAPMTSYAAIGPFEQLFAEGHVYRQAAEKPRKFIVVLGVWVIFGMMALAGAGLLFVRAENGVLQLIAGAFMLPVSLVMIWKTTRNCITRTRTQERRDA